MALCYTARSCSLDPHQLKSQHGGKLRTVLLHKVMEPVADAYALHLLMCADIAPGDLINLFFFTSILSRNSYILRGLCSSSAKICSRYSRSRSANSTKLFRGDSRVDRNILVGFLFDFIYRYLYKKRLKRLSSSPPGVLDRTLARFHPRLSPPNAAAALPLPQFQNLTWRKIWH